jgi:hypothetical protein
VWNYAPKEVPQTSLVRYYYTVDNVPDTVPTTADASSETPSITVSVDAPGTYWFHAIGEDTLGNVSGPGHRKFIVAP